MKRLLSLILTLVFLLALAVPASAAKAKAAVMRLQLSEGSVSVQDAGGKSISYQKNMRLYSGYTVSTGSGSSAYILLDDTKAVKLDRDTTVTIKKSGRKLQVKLKCGQLFFNVTMPLQANEALEIRTSSMVSGVRGSSGIVNLREVIYVTGHGVVSSRGESHPIKGGQVFQPNRGVSSAGITLLPSFFLKEVRDNDELREAIRAEGVYGVEQLIAEIPSAEAREERKLREAQAGVNVPPYTESVDPAFGRGTEEPEKATEPDTPETPDTQETPTETEPVYYTITWSDGKKVLNTEKVKEGEIPDWSGKAPTMEADAQYTYRFDGWTPEITAAAGDVTYTAVFTPKVREYTVTWLSDDMSVIDTSAVPYGETPRHADPAKASTKKASFEFVGWDNPIVPVTGDAVYIAVFEAVYDFTAIIPDGTVEATDAAGEVSLYTVSYVTPEKGGAPVTTARAGETFTFFLDGTAGREFTVRVNGAELTDDSVYYEWKTDFWSYTFVVPEDPVIEIELEGGRTAAGIK